MSRPLERTRTRLRAKVLVERAMMDVAMHLRFGTIACLLRRLAAAVVLAGLGGLTCASAQQQLMLPPPPAAAKPRPRSRRLRSRTDSTP